MARQCAESHAFRCDSAEGEGEVTSADVNAFAGAIAADFAVQCRLALWLVIAAAAVAAVTAVAALRNLALRPTWVQSCRRALYALLACCAPRLAARRIMLLLSLRGCARVWSRLRLLCHPAAPPSSRPATSPRRSQQQTRQHRRPARSDARAATVAAMSRTADCIRGRPLSVTTCARLLPASSAAASAARIVSRGCTAHTRTRTADAAHDQRTSILPEHAGGSSSSSILHRALCAALPE